MEKYSNFIQRFRYLIIILTVLLTVVMLKGTGILFSNIDNDYRSFFTKDNPELLAFDSIQNNFSKSDNFNNKTLEAIQWATEEAWQLK